jgi:hypothetical protein
LAIFQWVGANSDGSKSGNPVGPAFLGALKIGSVDLLSALGATMPATTRIIAAVRHSRFRMPPDYAFASEVLEALLAGVGLVGLMIGSMLPVAVLIIPVRGVHAVPHDVVGAVDVTTQDVDTGDADDND